MKEITKLFVVALIAGIVASAVTHFFDHRSPSSPVQNAPSNLPTADAMQSLAIQPGKTPASAVQAEHIQVTGPKLSPAELFEECQPVTKKSCATQSNDVFTLVKCLDAQKEQAEYTCQSKLKNVGTIFLNCELDIKNFCLKEGLGGGRIGKCLLLNADKIFAPACREALHLN